VLAIIALLFHQSRNTTLTAAALIQKAEVWQKESVSPGRSLLHRRFDLTVPARQSSKVPAGAHRYLDTWRNPKTGVRFSELRDSRGRLLESARIAGTLPPLTEESAWQFDPSPETYRALVPAIDLSKVEYYSDRIELRSSNVTLTLDRADFRPVSETIRTDDREWDFHEISNESVPETGSPLARRKAAATLPPALEEPLPAPAEPSRVEVAPQELDDVEVLVRVRLHQVAADLGEQIAISRSERFVEVSGVLDTASRREEISTGLANVPHVQVNLASPETLSIDGLREALLTPPPAVAVTAAPLLSGWLEKQYPEAAERRSYVDDILGLSRECLRRAYALHDLTARYPTLDNPQIRALAADHATLMQHAWRTLLNTVATPLEVRAVAHVAPPDVPVEQLVGALLRSTRAFDSNLAALFAGKESALAGSQGSSPVMADAIIRESRQQAQVICDGLESMRKITDE
jgi:hypothetical protein